RARSVDRIVTTAGETFDTRSAYEVCEGATPEVAEATAGCPLTSPMIPFWARQALTDTTKNAKLKNILTRESFPELKPFILSPFLIMSFRHLHALSGQRDELNLSIPPLRRAGSQLVSCHL